MSKEKKNICKWLQVAAPETQISYLMGVKIAINSAPNYPHGCDNGTKDMLF